MQLAAELGTDGSAGAGHQDTLARDVLADRGHVGGHRPAPEQVADARITHTLDLRPAGEQLPDRGDHLRNEPAALGRLGEVVDDLAAAPGDRDDQHPGAGAGGDLRHLVAATEHRNAMDPQPPLRRVIVEDRYRLIGRVGLRGQPVDQLSARVSGSEDDDLHGRRGGPAVTAASPRRRRNGRRASLPRRMPPAQDASPAAQRCPVTRARPATARQHAVRTARQRHRRYLVTASPQVPAAVEPGGETASGHQPHIAARPGPEGDPRQESVAAGPARPRPRRAARRSTQRRRTRPPRPFAPIGTCRRSALAGPRPPRSAPLRSRGLPVPNRDRKCGVPRLCPQRQLTSLCVRER